MLYSARSIPAPFAQDDAERARLFLMRHQSEFVGGDMPVELIVTRATRRQADRRSVVRLRQRHKGIDVNGAEAIVHLDGNGVRRVRARLAAGFSRIDVVPGITSRHAAEIASAVADGGTGIPHLELVDVARLRGHGVSAWQLAWRVDVAHGSTVWIDAHGGGLLHRSARVARAFLTYITDNNEICPSAPPLNGYDEASNYATAPPDVADAFAYLQTAYDYFRYVLGHDGLVDSSGAPRTINAVVRECADEFSAGSGAVREHASWDRAASTLRLGGGAARADDIVGHEYAHAVIDDSARFELSGQSGALAEAFADIFGELVDVRQATANDAGDTRWAIGEDAPGGPYRNLQNPALFQQPEKMTDAARYYCGFDAETAIHTNGSVVTHAFALLVDGGAFNGILVVGIDVDKAARIFHRALHDHLTSTATFAEAYEELLNAADDLIAEGVIAAADRVQLVAALNAVELHTPPCTSQVPYCAVRSAPTMTFYDGFEDTASRTWGNAAAGVNHWNTGSGTPDIYHATAIDPKPDDLNNPVTVSVPRRGHYGLWADGARDSAAADRRLGDSWVAMTQPIDVSSGAPMFMQFESQFAFQMWEAAGQPVSGPEPDGGVVEYSSDGVTWRDAAPLISGGQGYTGSIQTDYFNPLAGRGAFVGASGGYVSTQLDLTPLAGQRVMFRFRVGTDRTDGDIGWFVDDVAVYSCNRSDLVIEPAAGLETSEDGATATFTVALAAMPDAAVVVTITSSNPEEGSVEPAQLIFDATNWNVPRTVVVRGVDDDRFDGAQPYSIAVAIETSGDVAFQQWTAIPVSVTNRDNESRDKHRNGGGAGLLLSLLILIHAGRRLLRSAGSRQIQ
jgi:Zn-dependent metalloprotease